MDEDDPVVQEIPVFFSQTLADNLYVFQYPVKPADRNWNEAKVVNAAIKPENQFVKLEVALDTYSDKYSSSKGEQIALNTDGQQEFSKYAKEKDREKHPYFKDGIMNKIVYEGRSPSIDTSNYIVAILQDKELHCTPVKGIVQLRPSYSYFDQQDKRKKELDRMENSDDEEEVEAQQVTVKFARKETDVAKKARENSFEFISKKTAEEPWCEATWRHADTDYADLERLKLFCSETEDRSSIFSMPASEYVRVLVPPPPDDEAEPPPILHTQPVTNEQISHHEDEIVPKQRKKSHRDSFSDNTSSPKMRGNSISEDDTDSRKRPKNKSATGVGKRTRNVSSSSAHES
ncbi:DNA-directed RNA polymerase III subunit RPC5 [Eumeta japonica]|uniref:DNA-directed RNA polymerase III subunit RPC5 n=1 Tax=Eumeta variegata TaxID=151549 RepID=A0A4C1U0W0_EUMVA|nr:DNA-directed RNA polymerase III subunit RPC5 [Eumeta japonica]